MIILGIDPGTAITGFGIIKSEGNRSTPVKYGVIRTNKTYDLAGRLHKIYERIIMIAKEYKPVEVAVEQLFFNKNAKTALSVGHARGVVLLAAYKLGLRVSEYTPLQVKQAVVGYGRADKMQVQKMVKNILGLEDIPKPDDAADALAVAICHAHSRNLNKVLTNR